VPRTVQIDDDIYEVLKRQVDFRESESDVLRRLLSPLLQAKDCPTCGKAIYVANTRQIGDRTVYVLKCGHIFTEKTPEEPVSENQLPNGKNGALNAPVEKNGASALLHFITDPALLCRNTTERYLAILGFAYREKQEKFAKVLDVRGRSRKYFAGSREEIEKYGTSTHPHPIPGSEKKYWAMTNADTIQKREMLSNALKVLAYSPAEIEAASKTIADGTGTPV
jgi:negative regulator of replication initiation